MDSSHTLCLASFIFVPWVLEEAHQEVLQERAPELRAEVDAPCEVGGLLQECGVAA